MLRMVRGTGVGKGHIYNTGKGADDDKGQLMTMSTIIIVFITMSNE